MKWYVCRLRLFYENKVCQNNVFDGGGGLKPVTRENHSYDFKSKFERIKLEVWFGCNYDNRRWMMKEGEMEANFSLTNTRMMKGGAIGPRF